MKKSLALSGNDLTLGQLYQVVLEGFEVTLAPEARARMDASQAVVERLSRGDVAAYGINTGFGALASVRIQPEQIRELQLNLVRSHACGVGAPLAEDETRAMILLRANALSKGFSGVRPVVVETLLAMLNRGVLPVIPSQGSVGASGDLAPLAHLALVAIGEGEAIYKGARLSGGDALKQADITPLKLEAKEGLALLNGTQGMLALLALAIRDAEILIDTADVAAALSLDALRGSPAAFDERISRIRPYPGQMTSARNLTRLNRGSEIRESHRSAQTDTRVQDAYSLRCTPQVHGAVRDSLSQARTTLSIELNSATDNPLVFADSGEVVSGGNFHGQPLAMAADQIAIALATLAGICERRVEHMTNPHTSLLPPFLTADPGLNSGFMIAQVVAASLASELKALATPHSVDSIPTSGDQEDYVSMGMSASRRLERMLDALRNVIAIELLAACQGIDFQAPLQTGVEARKAYALVRSVSRVVDKDRALAPDIAAVAHLVAKGEFQNILR
ncbi:MAG: histidine ammonia-lyase [Candidatus Acidiferrales bacterium]|jgi:histidine ammonia-lyase|nr:histidine ammonia-lyase [Candidatus Acidoferrales bacterium]